MQSLTKMCFFCASILILSACVNTPVKGMPSWIDHPDKNQAVGTCGSHALGRHMQKECAMTRARLELAARQGVTIQSMSVMTEHANNLSSNSELSQQTIQEVNSKVKARLVESYRDREQDILWVLVEEL
jgi:hypothetical protein